MSEYYTKEEIYREKFIPVPQVFFTNPLYKDGLTDTQKLAFGHLKNRFNLSKQNEWFDEQGRIYFIFSQESLMEIFGCAKEKATNIKKALVKVGLLEVKRRGQGKTDLLYLKKPIVTENDIYQIKAAESLGAVETFENRTSRSTKTEPLDVRKSNAINKEINNKEIKENKNLVNKDEFLNTNIPFSLKDYFMDLANNNYEKMAVGRWSKIQWLSIIDKLINEMLDNDIPNTVLPSKWPAYIYKSLENICYKHDLKNEKIESKINVAENVPVIDWGN